MSSRATQKPNAACACGSGVKYKKCCGRAEIRAPAPAGAAGSQLSSAQRAALMEHSKLMNAAADASDAGDRARSARLHAKAAPYAAAAGIAGAPALAVTLDVQTGCLYRLSDFTGALDCGARALAMLLPPHRYFPAALATLTHAAWRDTPLEAADVAVTLPANLVEPLRRELLCQVHSALGNACSRSLLVTDAISHYEQGLEALKLQPASWMRLVQESSMQENIGNQYCRLRDPVRTAQHYDTARALLDSAERAGADSESLRSSRASLAVNSVALTGILQASAAPALDDAFVPAPSSLEALEALWHEQRLSEAPAALNSPADWGADVSTNVCKRALLACTTPAQQRPWLERMLMLPTGLLSAIPAVRLAGQSAFRGACRACAMPAEQAEAAGDKLRACVACKGVAYCSQECQREDWSRHKLPCRAQAAALAAGTVNAPAALEDATCIACRRGLAPQPGGAGEPELVNIMRCGHAGHTRCITALINSRPHGHGHAAFCPACDEPIGM